MQIQLLGVLILGGSAYLWWDSQIYLDLNELSEYYMTPFVAFLILGAVMTVVGFLGCCGAIRESSCILSLVWWTTTIFNWPLIINHSWIMIQYFLFCMTMCIVCGASLYWANMNEDMVSERKEKLEHCTAQQPSQIVFILFIPLIILLLLLFTHTYKHKIHSYFFRYAIVSNGTCQSWSRSTMEVEKQMQQNCWSTVFNTISFAVVSSDQRIGFIPITTTWIHQRLNEASAPIYRNKAHIAFPHHAVNRIHRNVWQR